MISERSRRLPPFYAMEILERAHVHEARGEHIIHLEIGEPDFPTPQPIVDAAVEALEGGHTRYTHSLGIMPLREAIAADYEREYGVEVSPENILVTNGTSPAMMLIFAALLEPGQEIMFSDPCYACYPNIAEFVDAVPRYVPVAEHDAFKYRPEHIEAAMNPNVKAIMINSPANPTGTVLSGDDISRIVGAAGDAFVISDEIYHGLNYEGKEHTALEYTDRCFVLNGFSKRYAMTGWRLGYIISPPEFVRPMQKIQQNLLICANSFVQWAGIVAFEKGRPYVEQMVATYDERRRFILEKLRGLGFGVECDPTGAFYVLANAKHLTGDSLSFCIEVLENARVALTPGIDFGAGGEGYVRFSYANSIDNISEAMDRLESFLAERDEKATPPQGGDK